MKTGINLSVCSDQIGSIDIIPYIQEAGFDACFWDAGENGVRAKDVADKLREYGLLFQSVHAPFSKMNRMWEDDGDDALAELTDCMYACADAGVPIMICHAFIGFGEEKPNETGIERFGTLLDLAEKAGVRIAFENTEGEMYLASIKEKLWSSRAAGFCIDTGHEICYNRGKDMIAGYGDKLIATHINDNMGVTGDQITWLDDSHMLPFDGIANWNDTAQRLKRTGYDGILTLELTTKSKPGRHTHDLYRQYDTAAFLRIAQDRARKIAGLIE